MVFPRFFHGFSIEIRIPGHAEISGSSSSHIRARRHAYDCGSSVDTSSMAVYMAVCQNLVPLVNIKIAGKWMFIPLKMVLIGIDPYPYGC